MRSGRSRLGAVGLSVAVLLAGCGTTQRKATAPATPVAAPPSSSAAAVTTPASFVAAPALTIQTGAAATMVAPVNSVGGTTFTDAAFPTPTDGWVSGVVRSNSACGGAADQTPATGLIEATTDGGASWNVVNQGVDGFDALYFANAEDGWAGQTDCATFGHPPCGGALLHTTDGGRSWAPVPAADPSPNAEDEGLPVIALAGQGGALWALEAGPEGSGGATRVMAGNATNSWTELSSLPLRQGGALLGAVGQLALGANGLSLASVYDSGSCTMAACGVDAVYQTTDGGKAWSAVPGQPTCNTAPPQVAATAGAELVARGVNLAACAGPQTTLSASTTGGTTWTTAITWSKFRPVALTAAANAGGGATVWAVGAGALLRSSDGGTAWTQQLPAPVPTGAIDFLSASYGWGVGTVSDPGTILRTTDGGQIWDVVSSVPEAALSGVTFTSADDGWVTGATPAWTFQDGVVWRTTDGGAIWAPAGSPAERSIPMPVATAFQSAQDGTLIGSLQAIASSAGCPTAGLFTSADGATWICASAVPNQQALLTADIAAGGTLWGIWSGNQSCGLLLGRGNAKTGKWTPLGCFLGYTGSATLEFTSATHGFAVMLAVLSPAGSGKAAVTRPVLLRTDDGGRRWTASILPLAANAFFGNHIFFLNAEQGWLLSGGAVWQTSDGGTSWTGLSS